MEHPAPDEGTPLVFVVGAFVDPDARPEGA